MEGSTRGDLLCYADPEWVARLSTGARWLAWALSGKIAAATMILCGAGLPGTWLWIGADLLWILAAWPLTAPDAAGVAGDRAARLRWRVRVTSVPALFGQLALSVVGTTAVPPVANAAVFAIAIAGVLADAAGLWAALQLFIILAHRIPARFYAGSSGFEMRMLVVPYGIFAAVSCCCAVQGSSGSGSGWTFLQVAVCGIGCVCVMPLLAFGFSMHAKMTVFARRLAEQATLARRPLAAPPPGP